MNRQQAMKLLGITQEDDEREIKRKYHKMIADHTVFIQRFYI